MVMRAEPFGQGGPPARRTDELLYQRFHMTRVLRGLAGLVVAAAAVTGLAGVVTGGTPPALTCSVAALLVITAVRPADGLLLLAAFGPFGGALGALVPYRDGWTVLLLLAFTAGYALRFAWRPRRDSDHWLLTVALVWVAIVICSLAMVLAAEPEAGVASSLFSWASQGFPMRGAIGAAAIAIADVVAFVATSEECAAHQGLDRRVFGALLVSVAATGALNVYRLFEIALRHPPFPESIVEVHRLVRISATFPDLNAAGAFFLLVLPSAICALGDSRVRALGASTLVPALAGLWLTGSRTALIVFALTLAAMALLAPGRSRRWRAGVAVVIVLAALLLGVSYRRAERASNSAMAFGVRREMAAATIRMLGQHPLAGLGVGQYRRLSPGYMSPLMKSWYPAENAHNQFLQVAGELGMPGFVAFVVLVGFGAVPAVRTIWQSRDPVDRGLALGVLAFLAASLTMHPLLIPEVAAAFWIVLGLCRSERGRRTPMPAFSRSSRLP
jgi:O-Antigen ligase